MKVVSDFDGVITELDHEGRRCAELFRSRLEELANGRTAELNDLLDRVETILNRESRSYGWRRGGKISAFGDEDLFIRNIAIADILDRTPAELDNDQPFLADIREAMAREGFEDFGSVSGWAYQEMVKETAAAELKPLEPEAVDVLRELLNRGDSVVVVSNSGTERILEMFQAVGLPATAYPERNQSSVCVRGGARKYELGKEDAPQFKVGSYGIETNRPSYRQILLEEKPDLVVGDVFSLDLALPLQMALTGELSNVRALLRKRAYTPVWSESFCRENPQAAVIENYRAILEI